MKEYNPICFLAYLVGKEEASTTLHLTVPKFNEELHKIENTLWDQGYHMGFGFEEFVERVYRTLVGEEWMTFDEDKLVLSINIDDELKSFLKLYTEVFELPKLYKEEYQGEKWEYKESVYDFYSDGDFIKFLNEHGKEGWEYIKGNRDGSCYFKRKVKG